MISQRFVEKSEEFSNGYTTALWNVILERFNCISKQLHSVQIDITIVVSFYKSLIHYIGELQNSYTYYEKLDKKNLVLKSKTINEK